MEWAKHKTKLGDPVKNLSESINTNVSAAFGKTINTDADQSNAIAGSIALTSSELTISGGSITITRSHHTIDTQSDGATDDLDTIVNSGTADGAVVFLRAENAARITTIKDNVGNIQTKDNKDVALDANFPTKLTRVGTSWYVSDNPFDQYLNTVDDVTHAAGTFTGIVRKNGTHPIAIIDITTSRTLVTGDSTAYTIDWNRKVKDQGTNFDTATDIYTAPVDGTYQVSGTLVLTGLTSSHTDGVLQLKTNTVVTNNLIWDNPWAVQAALPRYVKSFTMDVDLTAGDELELVYTVSNGTKVVNVFGATGNTTWNIKLIG